MTRKSEVKAKSVRKPLRDVSNNNGGGTGRSSRSVVAVTKKSTEKDKENRSGAQQDGERDGDALDRLLLVHSDLSSLTRQIDELVAQAFDVKAMGQQGSKEVESFARVLSEILSSLQPWVPRFQKVLSGHSLEPENQSRESLASQVVSSVDEANKSLEQTNVDSLLSPSPLVSWRANCTIDRGRQLFLLTPLPISKTISSKHLAPSKSVFERITLNTNEMLPSFNSISEDRNNDLPEGVTEKPTPSVTKKPTPSKHSDFVSTETGSTQECGVVFPMSCAKRESSVVVSTPCLKVSPPKSCVLLEPISEPSHKDHDGFRKSTPYPVGFKNCWDSESSESSSSDDACKSLAFKYPELLGIQQAHKPGYRKKQIEASPDWFMSPPKTCVLLELPDEKTLENAAMNCQLPLSGHVPNNQANPSVVTEIEGQGSQQTKTFSQKGGGFTLIESTPIWRESESIIHRSKHPGENTLKKELWTKFEAASCNGIRFNVSVVRETMGKGFLDRLDEVSHDGEI